MDIRIILIRIPYHSKHVACQSSSRIFAQSEVRFFHACASFSACARHEIAESDRRRTKQIRFVVLISPWHQHQKHAVQRILKSALWEPAGWPMLLPVESSMQVDLASTLSTPTLRVLSAFCRNLVKHSPKTIVYILQQNCKSDNA